jgi:hypothetical protein
MEPMDRLTRALLVLLLLAPVACGDDDGNGGGGPAPTDPQALAERDGAEAERIAFHVYDFPSGWSLQAADAPTPAVVPDEFNACVGGPIRDDQLSARRAATFQLNANVQAASQVSRARAADALEARAAIVGGEAFVTCMQTAMRPVLAARLPAGVAAGQVDARRGTLDVSGGTGAKVSMVLTGADGTRVYLVFGYMRRERTEAVVALYTTPDRFDVVLEDNLLRTVAGRIVA